MQSLNQNTGDLKAVVPIRDGLWGEIEAIDALNTPSQLFAKKFRSACCKDPCETMFRWCGSVSKLQKKLSDGAVNCTLVELGFL